MKTETKIKITEIIFFIIFLIISMFLMLVFVVFIKKYFGIKIPWYFIPIIMMIFPRLGDSSFNRIKKYFKEKIKNYYEKEEPYNKN